MNKHNIHEYWHLLEAMRAGKTIQLDSDEGFIDLNNQVVFNYPAHQYSIKTDPRRAYFCNGVEVPEPLSVAPPIGTYCFIPSFTKAGFLQFSWDGYAHELEHLNDSIIYLTREHAIARAKAMMILDVREVS